MTEPIRVRLAARVLLFDPEGRLLLLKGRLPSAPDAPGWWFTVGGGMEPGESVREAALREIAEETGFTEVTLGEILFQSDEVLRDRKQRPVRHRSTFLFARCGGGQPSRDGWQALEREFVDDIRWWTLDDLAAMTEPVYPTDLAQRARAAWSTYG
jgi:8-oxo-dGTP pyrophosphatase MutT (NUDIX family)